MPKIGLVTCERFRAAATDDDILASEFIRRGYYCDRPAWEDKSVLWHSYDALLIRSTWDYQYHLQDFLSWIQSIESLKIPLYNSPRVIRWNCNKLYLRELQDKQILIPETEWIAAGSPFDLSSIMDARGWQQAVVKPVVGGGGYSTYLISRQEAKNHPVLTQKEVIAHGTMVQEFLPEIQEHGEWSFLFFNHKFSHAVIKKPSDKEFRVQTQHGGTVENIRAPHEYIQHAEQVLRYAPDKLLYARVDGIIRNGKFILIELEILEPWFYLAASENSKNRVVDAFEELKPQ